MESSFQNSQPPTMSMPASSSSSNPMYAQSIEQAEEVRVNKYETKLPIRIDIMAALCYLFGCITGIIFLILETKNDYVRFHAWQSCLVFTPLLVLHFCFLFVPFMSWVLFILTIGLIIFLGLKAYQNGQTLERYEFPVVGRIAAQWVDSE